MLHTQTFCFLLNSDTEDEETDKAASSSEKAVAVGQVHAA